jgi:peptidoglycan hydrolase CwlO-like protein
VRMLVIASVLLVSTIASAQQPPDPRICAVQLTTAESDAGNLLQRVHSLGAQVDILKADLEKANARIKELEPKVDEKAKK